MINDTALLLCLQTHEIIGNECRQRFKKLTKLVYITAGDMTFEKINC